uniref:Uncharacterized protein n=1 Tax=Arundo donax TaxID=35708 RepID=A0A0A9FI60_ARUDO
MECSEAITVEPCSSYLTVPYFTAMLSMSLHNYSVVCEFSMYDGCSIRGK